MQRGITLEQKLRYLKEIDNIHALSKKVRPPAGKSWSDIAASRMRHVMGLPIREPVAKPLQIQRGRLHHEHSPRSARIIERTLKTGLVHPDVLQSYRTGASSRCVTTTATYSILCSTRIQICITRPDTYKGSGLCRVSTKSTLI